jgi:molybdate transport system substrate-binding protein
MRIKPALAALFILAALASNALAKDLVVLCAGAVKPALSILEPIWSARGGSQLQITYASAGELRRMLAAGDPADIVILPLESFAQTERDGVTDAVSRRDLGAVGIGVAVAAGASLPDLSSEEGLKQALLVARSITFMDPERGTSGKYFDEVVLPRLAIRDAVRAKTVLGEGGMIAEKVARGEVDMAFQQMTELLPVAGIRIAGGLPPSLQKTTVYSGAVLKKAASPADAASLLTFLSTGEGRQVFLARGFTAP